MANINMKSEAPYSAEGALVQVRVGGEKQPMFSFHDFPDGVEAAAEHAKLLNKHWKRQQKERRYS